MLVGIGTFLLMVAVVLLGNCNFTMQVAIGSSYVVLNGAFWTAAIINKKKFWDLSAYVWKDITPPDAQNAHSDNSEDPPSFTRTMWYALRETRKAGWVKISGAAPTTIQWDQWLKEAEENAVKGNRKWKAVDRKDSIVGETDSFPQAQTASLRDTAEQHAPAVMVPAPSTIPET